MQITTNDDMNVAAKGSKICLNLLDCRPGRVYFRFDTVVISGANLPIKELWHTSPWFHGIYGFMGNSGGRIVWRHTYTKYGRKKYCYGSAYYLVFLQ